MDSTDYFFLILFKILFALVLTQILWDISDAVKKRSMYLRTILMLSVFGFTFFPLATLRICVGLFVIWILGTVIYFYKVFGNDDEMNSTPTESVLASIGESTCWHMMLYELYVLKKKL